MEAIIGTGNMSKRQYGILEEPDVSVPMSDGAKIDIDVFRPDAKGEKFPALVSISPYPKKLQSKRIWPEGMGAVSIEGTSNASIEAGNNDFFVRRGYAHVVGSVRGTDKSGGIWDMLSRREVRDNYVRACGVGGCPALV